MSAFSVLFESLQSALGAPSRNTAVAGEGGLPSAFPVSDLAAASIAAAGCGIAERMALAGGAASVKVDRRLASFWFAASCSAVGWKPAPPWDPIAGDYPARDGFIRLHTNAPHHRQAALAALGVEADRDKVAKAVALWSADELESAIVASGGCAAAMRSREDWARHAQGAAVAAEPLVRSEPGAQSIAPESAIDPARPLAGLRVLDLTRVLAGPVSTRFLAGYGAQVLRIDPPSWDEPGVLPDVTLGKRCARLDLKTTEGKERLEALLAQADVLVHGYRSDALDRLGFGAARRQAIRPGLVDVSLDAYGFTGPWARRRGFDSLVQMSSGIADFGMKHYGADRPRPLPVQALDHAAGYVMAASVLHGLNQRSRTGQGSLWRTSLARVAEFLASAPAAEDLAPLAPIADADYAPDLEQTAWGPLRRLHPPLEVEGAPAFWALPAGPLGRDPPAW
jgi:CoA-transferase family III